jgi:hypothetical protein
VGDGTCSGQYDHTYINGQLTTFPLPDLSAVDITEYTIEFFFKTSDPTAIGLEVIMGLTPVKIRKKGATARI